MDTPFVSPPPASLSARERTIVVLMSHGHTNKSIARALSIAPETVKSHAKRIFQKLEVQTRAQAVYRAWTLGLLLGEMPVPRGDGCREGLRI
jgi:LuxR family maltose regulon positive regulatory protein